MYRTKISFIQSYPNVGQYNVNHALQQIRSRDALISETERFPHDRIPYYSIQNSNDSNHPE